MRGKLDPEASFQNIPGIGPVFARLIHEHLHVDTLEALEAAAHDGRLDTVPGIGERLGQDHPPVISQHAQRPAGLQHPERGRPRQSK